MRLYHSPFVKSGLSEMLWPGLCGKKKAIIVQCGNFQALKISTGQFQQRSNTSGTKVVRCAAAMHFGKGCFVKVLTHFAV